MAKKTGPRRAGEFYREGTRGKLGDELEGGKPLIVLDIITPPGGVQ